MSDDLVAWITNQLELDQSLSDDCRYIVLAALESEGALHDALETPASERPSLEALAEAPVPAPVGAFLSSIAVQGFRGVGAPATLTLAPHPGLTIIAGRNGSGKSSFAEALELAITGDSYRWKTRAKTWSSSWRNLHVPHPSGIRVELAEEGRGKTTVGIDWQKDAGLDDRQAWVQRHGAKREHGLSSLGWVSLVEAFRPLLTYEELGGVLEAEPKQLYDALARVLGLERITDGLDRLTKHCKELEQPASELRKARLALRDACAALDDSRASEAAGQLRKTSPDLDALRSVSTGSSSDPLSVTDRLRQIATLAGPNNGRVEEVASEMEAAWADVNQATDDDQSASARRKVVRAALDFYTSHGSGECPVCGQGEISAGWAEQAHQLLSETTAAEERATIARQRLDNVRSQASLLVSHIPDELFISDLPLESLPATRDAWGRLASLPSDNAEIAGYLRTRAKELANRLELLRSEARASAEARDDAWAPLALRLAAWVEQAMAVETSRTTAELARQALTWLKENDQRLKNERVKAIADRAREIWAELRQESNVDIEDLKLRSSNTRRSVEITASVDGENAGALAVMSQGELHSLALALFLPRATMPSSPFRFVVLDDPVQAMDPSKVDGLVRVLTQIAAERQVIVFSHDDRLADATRRGAPDARILEVTRGTRSDLKVRVADDPAARYLDDAYAISKDAGLPASTLRMTLPNLLRLAVESAARDTFFTRRFRDGDPVARVVDEWNGLAKTGERVALAVLNDGRARLDPWLAKRTYRRRALGICTSGAHSGLHGQPAEVIDDVRRMVSDLREVRP